DLYHRTTGLFGLRVPVCRSPCASCSRCPTCGSASTRVSPASTVPFRGPTRPTCPPWRWVAGGEFLMTNGMSMPRTASGQEELVRQLVEHGAAALAIGAEMYSPPLTRRLARVSEEMSFPVLWVSYPLPFISISRTV